MCANLHLRKKKKKNSAGGEWIVEQSPKILASEEKSHHHELRSGKRGPDRMTSDRSLKLCATMDAVMVAMDFTG